MSNPIIQVTEQQILRKIQIGKVNLGWFEHESSKAGIHYFTRNTDGEILVCISEDGFSTFSMQTGLAFLFGQNTSLLAVSATPKLSAEIRKVHKVDSEDAASDRAA